MQGICNVHSATNMLCSGIYTFLFSISLIPHTDDGGISVWRMLDLLKEIQWHQARDLDTAAMRYVDN